MKVLLDRGNAPPKTGIGIHADCLLLGLQKYCSDELSVFEARVSHAAHTNRPLRRLLYLWELHRLINRGYDGAEVVHFLNYYVPRRIPHVAYVATIFDLDALMLPEAHTRRFVLYFKNVVRKSVMRSHIIETSTEAVRCELMSVLGADGEKIRVTGSGLSPEFMNVADVTAKSKPDLPVLLYVGQLGKKKNVAWLIRTVVQGVRRKALPKMKLLLAGRPGFGFTEIERELRQSEGIVSWTDSPSMREIVEMICGCSALILPSFREGFGRPLLEAMYCDKPIVASRIPTSVEVAGDAAHFFSLSSDEEFYEAVNKSLADQNKDKRQDAASHRLSNYSWKNLAYIYRNIYREARLKN